jgi:hypothetical protein
MEFRHDVYVVRVCMYSTRTTRDKVYLITDDNRAGEGGGRYIGDVVFL